MFSVVIQGNDHILLTHFFYNQTHIMFFVKPKFLIAKNKNKERVSKKKK